MPRVEQPAPAQQVQVLDQEDTHVAEEQIKTIEPTEVEMFEEDTTKKNYDTTQEVLVAGSPSVKSSSHQTSVSSFDPDSYRDDAFNIAALLKADCITLAEASSTVIEVQSPESSVVHEDD